MSDEAAAPRRRALYGRSRGKTLRQRHAGLMRETLPGLEIAPEHLRAGALLFAKAPEEIWLEIGFGGGEHLLDQAAANPDVGFIGCEPFVNGVAKLLAGAEDRGLANLRVRAGDALDLIEAMPPAFLSRAFCLYPDPWPKRRQNKRRIIGAPLIDALARAMRPGAELRFASDIDDYCGWTLRRFAAHPAFVWNARQAADWLEPWPGWRPTRYEEKARREGRTSSYLTFVRV